MGDSLKSDEEEIEADEGNVVDKLSFVKRFKKNKRKLAKKLLNGNNYSS